MNVNICICTYKRPALLRRLLVSLPPVRTIVVDNDAERSAESVCSDFNVIYACEPRRGISHARNAAFRLAATDLIACIDDDEWPCATWLSDLMETQQRFDADVVIGPVVPEFDPSAPEWVKRGGFFSRPRYETGTDVTNPYIGNALIHRRTIPEAEPFNPAFGLTGAEDTELFMRMRRRGAQFVYCKDAFVHEHIPLDRCTARYIRNRAFSGGNTFTALSHESRVKRGIKGVARVALGSAVVPIAALRGTANLVKAQQSIWLGLGTLSALSGHRFYFYR